jgi:hypothetical protein
MQRVVSRRWTVLGSIGLGDVLFDAECDGADAEEGGCRLWWARTRAPPMRASPPTAVNIVALGNR